MSYFVYSTLSTNQIYVNYAPIGEREAAAATRIEQVLIKGGANIAMPAFGNKTHAVEGVLTEISDEQYDFLKHDASFQAHVRNGFITAIDSKEALEVVKADMEAKDESAQAVAEDFEKDSRLFAGGDTHAPASVGSVESNDKE